MMRNALFSLFTKTINMVRGHGLMIRYPFLRPLHKLYKSIYNYLRPHKITVHGYALFLDPDDSLELARRGEEYEKKTVTVFRRCVVPGCTVVDIGANLGYFSLLASGLVGEGGKVYAFEPDPKFVTLLEKNIQENRCVNIEVVPFAVSEKVERNVDFYTPGFLGSELADFEMYKTYGPKSKIIVSTTTLDSFFEGAQCAIDLVKMDIEGAEGRAFRGMRRVIQQNPQLKIIAEFQPKLMELSGTDPRSFLNELKSAGFLVFDIDGLGGLERPVTAEYLLSTYQQGNIPDHTNIFCTRT